MTSAPRVVVLVGMSGVGKSLQAARLARSGARVFDCDADIGARLGEIIAPAPGEAPVTALGRWMGLPSSEGYREREARYLALEAEVTIAAMDGAAHENRRVAIDTTGSVVHLPSETLDALRACGHVVYLRVPPDERDAMLRRYLAEPKPVVFGAAWSAEGPDALARAYGALLSWRDARYSALAHDTVDARALDAEGGALRRVLGW